MRYALYALVLMLHVSIAWAAPRITEDILPMGLHPPGTSQSSAIAVLPEDRFVTIRLDRSQWTVTAGVLRFTIEAEMHGEWQAIKAQETHGKAVGTSAPSRIFMSIPDTATAVRGQVVMGGPPGTYRVWLEVGP